MSVRAITATALLTGASFLAIGAAAPAYALCDAYSGGCPTPPPAGGGGGTDISGGDDSPATGNDNPTTGNPGTDSGAGAGAGRDVGGTSGGPAGTGGGSGTTTSPTTLPFTGGELILMSALGLGVLAGGTALVVAGRRKAGTAA